MDYYEIGQRIKRFRKANHLSQEGLAEKVGISTTHMSHIETGNTKLSLSVLVEIAVVLGVRTDDILFDGTNMGRSSALEEIAAIFEDCSTQQVNVLRDVIKAAKTAMDKHL